MGNYLEWKFVEFDICLAGDGGGGDASFSRNFLFCHMANKLIS